MSGFRIEALAASSAEVAVDLLARFFAEEGFATPRSRIVRHLAGLLGDPMCWGALAIEGDSVLGIVTVTTMRYVEWGLLGEIGDLYVLPEHRRRGVAKALVATAREWCSARDCAAVSVTITPEGEARHRLSRFYAALGFEAGGRTIMTASLVEAGA